jgi:hypothetical protein
MTVIAKFLALNIKNKARRCQKIRCRHYPCFLCADGGYDMGKRPFEIFGPFQFNADKIADKEYQKAFWSECDEEYAQISEANGLYLFSLSNGSNYEPNYVGITKREFCKEVFNPSNVVKILNYFAPQRGKLNLHLIAKPKDDNAGFYKSSRGVFRAFDAQHRAGN